MEGKAAGSVERQGEGLETEQRRHGRWRRGEKDASVAAVLEREGGREQ